MGDMVNSSTTRPDDVAKHTRTAVRLAWATIAYNVLEAVVAITAGTVASSIALVGFGLDSTVEVMSATVIVWQFRGLAAERERVALRLIAASFFALGTYTGVRAIVNLAEGSEPDASPVGIAIAALSVIVMPFLVYRKRRVGRALGSVTVLADSSQTQLCTYISVVLLVGLILNATVGWWWADPVAAIGIALLALNEGREAWRAEPGDHCC